MSYYPAELKIPLRLEVAVLSWVSASESVGDDFTLTLLSHTWETAPQVAGTSITLPAGQYIAQAFVSATRSTANANARFSFALDGVVSGEYGQTDMYDNFQCDTADISFSVAEGGSAALSLRLLSIETELPVVIDNSRIVLWRCPNVRI